MANSDRHALIGLSRQVLYEFEMVEFLAARLLDFNLGRPTARSRDRFGTPDPLDRHPFEWNAMLESLLIHVRQLTHFLFESPPSRERRDSLARRGKAAGLADAFAEDYFDDPTRDWRKHSQGRGKRPTVLAEGELNRISREVAHLTYERAGFKDQGSDWSAHGLYQAVGGPMERFAERVDSSKLTPDFKERAAAAMYPRQPRPKRPRNPGGFRVSAGLPVATQGMFPKRD